MKFQYLIYTTLVGLALAEETTTDNELSLTTAAPNSNVLVDTDQITTTLHNDQVESTVITDVSSEVEEDIWSSEVVPSSSETDQTTLIEQLMTSTNSIDTSTNSSSYFPTSRVEDNKSMTITASLTSSESAVNTTDFNSITESINTVSNSKNVSESTTNNSTEVVIEDNIEQILNDTNSTALNGSSEYEYGLNRTDQDEDPESHFMSFEEWKKQKVEKDAPPRKLKTQENRIPVRQINNNINGVIGDDMEIDIGMFSGSLDELEEGGKVYKDRFNYASFDCAATIVKTNSEAKGASSILNENKDSYLLNVCEAPNKFVTIELCQDILVDTVMIGNYEFFSSNFKKIRLSVSDRFPIPVNGWTVLGEFEGDNIRALQTFNVKNPLIWARYLRLEILSYYGNEYYCPLSVIRVHGQTMIDEFKNEEDEAERENLAETVSSAITDVATGNSTNSTNLLALTGDNETNSTFENSVVDPERIHTLNEECSVVLPHLGIEQFLEELYSTDKDFCEQVEEQSSQPPPMETREPTTQESIYKNIVKRLSLLESNASLSLLYIEEQSKLLSNAFTKLEKRQTTKFDLLVSAFNETMNAQISHMQDLYTNLQQETAIILANQRIAHHDLLLQSTRKLNSVSSELTFFRRLAIFNSIFILCLLAYVIATRETYIETEYIVDEDDGSWNYNTPQPASPLSPGSPISPANSLVNIDKLKKKKIKFSVSHKLGNGTMSPINNGSFYFEPHSSDEYLLRHRRSISGSNDSESIKSGTIFTEEEKKSNSTKGKESDDDDDDESVELEMKHI